MASELVIGGTPDVIDRDGDPRPSLKLVRLRRLWIDCLVLVGVQTAALFGWSVFQARRFALGLDFSIYNQGAWLIARGHFNPWSTIDGFAFIRDHCTLLMWPLSAVYAVFPRPVTLLLLQDAASVGAGLVALRWILEILEYRLGTTDGELGRSAAVVIAGGAALAIVVDPWVWQADAFDFHMEAFAALFIVAASRDFWRHRPGRALGWCALALASGDFGGLFVVGLAVSVIVAAVGYRRWGGIALAMGAAWIWFVHRFNLSVGDLLQSYSALVFGSSAHPGTVTITNLAKAIVAHPARWMASVRQKQGFLYENVIPTGFLGLVNPWTFGVTGVVLAGAAFIGPTIYLQSGFQALPAYAIGVAGSVLTVVALLTAGDPRHYRRVRRGVAGLIGLAVLSQVIGLAVVMFPRTATNWVRISGTQAAVLSTVLARTPPDAQVIISDGVMGRFSSRQWVEPISWNSPVYPVQSRVVVFVIVPEAGIESLAPDQELHFMSEVRTTLHARPIATSHGIYAFLWRPGPEVHSVTITAS